MPAFGPPAPLLCVLLCVSVALQRSDPRLAYMIHNNLCYYSCSQDTQPCITASLIDCMCKDIQLSALHHPQLHARCLTVWFTSPSNTAHLLNNSEIRHLTLINCGPRASKETPSLSPEGYFAVHHLERLTVINLPQRPLHPCPDTNRATNSDLDNGAHLDTNRYNRDTNLDLIPDIKRDPFTLSSAEVQDIFLGRELGAAYYEQARLGIIHSSVLEWGSEVKAYTIQTHIDSDGTLPFPELHLQELTKTSVIYVSFVY